MADHSSKTTPANAGQSKTSHQANDHNRRSNNANISQRLGREFNLDDMFPLGFDQKSVREPIDLDMVLTRLPVNGSSPPSIIEFIQDKNVWTPGIRGDPKMRVS
jgi:hypothetical protein